MRFSLLCPFLKSAFAFMVLLSASSCCTPSVIMRPPGCNPEKSFQLDMKNQPQQSFEWCWAASGEMAMEFVDSQIKVCQCQQATMLFCRSCPGKGCCTVSNDVDPCNNYFLFDPDSPCDQPAWPDFKDFGFAEPSSTSERALSFRDIQTELYCNKKPVIFSWHEIGRAHV